MRPGAQQLHIVAHSFRVRDGCETLLYIGSAFASRRESQQRRTIVLLGAENGDSGQKAKRRQKNGNVAHVPPQSLEIDLRSYKDLSRVLQ